jgi:transcriptional regulator with XRE-family HTH domain
MTIHAEELRLRLARNVASARAARGWTQDALASRAGVSRATIIQVESGENATDIKLSTVADLAAALETSPMLLFVGGAEVEALNTMMHAPETIEEITSNLDEAASRPIAHLPHAQKKAGAVGVRVAGAAGLASGASVGAAIGTIVLPGVGTVIGAALGALLGRPVVGRHE